MRVLFLDFDGVLNCQKWIASAKDRCNDPWPGPRPPTGDDPNYRALMDEWLRIVRQDEACQEHSRKRELSHINPANVAHLNTIVEKTGCVICVSSAWRVGHEVEHLAALLKDSGFLYPENVISKTGNNGHRGQEIADWISDWEEDEATLHRMIRVPDADARPIEGIVIVDDEGRLEPYSDWHVKPEFWGEGLTAEHAEQAIEVLFKPFANQRH